MNPRSGSTALYVILGILIFILLASLSVLFFYKPSVVNKDQAVISQVNTVENYLESSYKENGYYPDSDQFRVFIRSQKNISSYLNVGVDDAGTYNRDHRTGQTFRFLYFLPSEIDSKFFIDSTPDHIASSCDTQGVCAPGDSKSKSGVAFYISYAPQQILDFVFPSGADNRQGNIIMNKLQALGFTHNDNIGQLYQRSLNVKDIQYDSNYFKSLKIFDDEYIGSGPEKIILILQAIKEGSTDLFYKACDKNDKCFNVDAKVSIGNGGSIPRVEGRYYGGDIPMGINTFGI